MEKSADQNLGIGYVMSMLITEISGILSIGTIRNGMDPSQVPACGGHG